MNELYRVKAKLFVGHKLLIFNKILTMKSANVLIRFYRLSGIMDPNFIGMH